MTGPPDKPTTFIVLDNESGQRLDVLVRRRAPHLGRKSIANLCSEGRVRLDGSRVSKGSIVSAGQQVTLELPALGRALPEPDYPLEVVLARDDLVIANKPPGTPSVATRTNQHGTLAGALLARFPEMADVGFGALEPGLVHRLDTFTSGLVVAARTPLAFAELRRALGAGKLVKRYLALALGLHLPDVGCIDANIEPHPKNRRKVLVTPSTSERGRPSRTDYRVLERRGSITLLEVAAGAAYRHQVRAHLAFAGSPLVGDALYGAPPCPTLGEGRHALHAFYMRSVGAAIADFEVEIGLPEDMQRCFFEAASP